MKEPVTQRLDDFRGDNLPVTLALMYRDVEDVQKTVNRLETKFDNVEERLSALEESVTAHHTAADDEQKKLKAAVDKKSDFKEKFSFWLYTTAILQIIVILKEIILSIFK